MIKVWYNTSDGILGSYEKPCLLKNNNMGAWHKLEKHITVWSQFCLKKNEYTVNTEEKKYQNVNYCYLWVSF